VTTLLCWLSVDARGPSAIYIVTDSRLLGDHPQEDGTAAESIRREVFGYFWLCGEVLFPSLVLGQLGDLVDRGVLWAEIAKLK
jgi:hypothetical protein